MVGDDPTIGASDADRMRIPALRWNSRACPARGILEANLWWIRETGDQAEPTVSRAGFACSASARSTAAAFARRCVGLRVPTTTLLMPGSA